MKNSFVLYNDYRKHITLLSDTDKGKLLDAIFSYADGEEVELDGSVGMAFSFIKAQMDRDAAKWEEERQARSEAGKRGMATRWGEHNKDITKDNSVIPVITKDNSVIPAITDDNKAYQDITNITVNVTDTVTDTVNVTENVKDKGINYQLVADMFNDICISFPKVTKLSDSRKRAIRARLRQYSMDDLKRAFEIAEQSNFLKGVNNKNWSANFDWLMKDNNLAKVLDGNYTNRGQKIEIDNKLRNFIEQNQVVDFGM